MKNDVTKGYKPSPLGLIPNDWHLIELGEVIVFPKKQVDPKIEPYRSSPLIAPNHIESGSGVLITIETAEEQGAISGKYMVEKDDVIYSKIRPYLKKVYFSEIEGLCSADMYPLKSTSNLNRRFLYYLLLSNRFTFFVNSQSGRTGIPKVNRDELSEFPALLPGFKEQTAIANLLRTWDKAINTLSQLIAQKEQRKKWLLQQLLTGKKRLKGFKGEWKEITLGEVADKSKKWSFTGGPFGSNLKAEDYTNDGVRIIQLQNIGDGVFHNEYQIFTTERKANELLSCNIYPGDIIISKMGDPVARACFVPTYQDRYLMASDGIRLAVDKKKFNNKFIHDCINFNLFRKKAIEVSTGSTRQRIGLDELRNLTLIAPGIEEQTAIAKILYTADNEIQFLLRKGDALKKQKQGLMQVLLTGKKRLKK